MLFLGSVTVGFGSPISQPQPGQNLSFGASFFPQCMQKFGFFFSAVDTPQTGQNLSSAPTAAPQFLQVMAIHFFNMEMENEFIYSITHRNDKCKMYVVFLWGNN